MNREAIFTALARRIEAIPGIETFSRQLKHWSDTPISDHFYFKIASCNFEVVGCGENVVSPCYGYGVVSVPCLSKCYAFRRDIRVAHSNSK